MRSIQRARRWWFHQVAVNPSRINCWIAAFLSIVATAALVALVVRFIG